MKIFLSIVTLGVLALIIHKLGAKKIVHEIEDTFSPHTENNNEQAPVQNSELVTDAKTLADLENNNKDLVSRIKKLQDAGKWNVKDAKGFYYSVDSKGEIFSGGNSSEEYETMAKQLADYNAKKEELTKKIASESTDADKQSLELPLALKAIIESIKLKFSHKSSLDDDGQSADEQNDEGQNNDDDAENNYSDNTYSDGGDYGGGYGGYGGSGGGGATPYVPPFPPLTPAQAAIISPAVVTPVTPLTTVTATPAPAPMITPFHFNPKRFFINPMHLANPVGASARYRRR